MVPFHRCMCRTMVFDCRDANFLREFWTWLKKNTKLGIRTADLPVTKPIRKPLDNGDPPDFIDLLYLSKSRQTIIKNFIYCTTIKNENNLPYISRLCLKLVYKFKFYKIFLNYKLIILNFKNSEEISLSHKYLRPFTHYAGFQVFA